jgi:hypothetical protein
VSEPRQLSAKIRELLAHERALGPVAPELEQRVLQRARDTLSEDRPSGVLFRRSFEQLQLPRSGARRYRAVLLVAAAAGVASLAAAGGGLLQVLGQPEPVEAAAPRSKPVSQVPKSARLAPALPQELPSELAAPSEALPPVESPPPRERLPREPRTVAPDSGQAPAQSLKAYELELGLLQPARSSIARGDFAAALAAVSQHQREYPRGQLTEEREALRVRALWGLGQKDGALRAAAAFRKRYPRSVLLSWMSDTLKP